MNFQNKINNELFELFELLEKEEEQKADDFGSSTEKVTKYLRTNNLKDKNNIPTKDGFKLLAFVKFVDFDTFILFSSPLSKIENMNKKDSIDFLFKNYKNEINNAFVNFNKKDIINFQKYLLSVEIIDFHSILDNIKDVANDFIINDSTKEEIVEMTNGKENMTLPKRIFFKTLEERISKSY